MAANLQSMIQYWKNFDLQELQKQLDSTATDLAARQDESDTSRKRLVDQSREFKKNTPEESRKVVAPLLKNFQGEIDFLSKRSKNAEAAFLSVYKKLIDVPDPLQVLEHANHLQKKAHRVQDLEIENKQLRETLEDYNNEFAEVKNQQVTIKQLREKVREYEDTMEATAQARAKDKEKDLHRQFTEKERHLQEMQMNVAKKLGEAEHRAATLQGALDSVQSELFDLKAKYDEATSAKSDEMDILMSDVERANERALSSEREADRFRQQLASATQNLQQAEQMQKAPDMEQAIDILKRSSLEVELAAKEKEISQLVEDVQRLQSSLNKLRESTTSQVAKLEEELSSKTRAFSMLEEKLKMQLDYDEVKRELSILKSMEFSHNEAAQSTATTEQKPKTLEVLLLEKNRTLQNENTHLKLGQTDVSGSPELKPPGPLSNTDMFASMIGQEIVASYHLQTQLHLAASLENGIVPVHPHPAQLVAPPICNGLTSPGGPSVPASRTPSTTPPTPNLTPTSQQSSQPPTSTPAPPQTISTPIQSTSSAHLQRINIITKTEPGSGQCLDTGEVSQRIREILSVHNIGQRLFAKHVLGLSQGTVSELLSKPKHWDKLTEKGRESYRKMYAWAMDEHNVMALKSISPKKGTQSIVPNARLEDAVTEERITQILSDAQAEMQAKQQVHEEHVTNAVVNSIYQQELAKMQSQKPFPPRSPSTSSNSSQQKYSSSLKKTTSSSNLNNFKQSEESCELPESPRGRRPQTDSADLSTDFVARIYREELSKLADAAERNGNTAECAMYRQELVRISMQAHCKMEKPSCLSSSEDKENSTPHPARVKKEPFDSTGSDSQTGKDFHGLHSPIAFNMREPPQDMPQDLSIKSANDSSSPGFGATHDSASGRHAGSAFFLVHPRSNGKETQQPEIQNGVNGAPFSPVSSGTAPSTPEAMSPLQRMQSIANSLMAKTQSPGHAQRPLKAVLPPISQEQFDRFTNMNTDDLVKKVKDALSQFSISQRLFGENVLGLSQGSVSDLLARPKPWHMLTQKGREPFIRMQIFLEDPEAITRLVANQYRIPPEKLLRTQSTYLNEHSAHRRRKGGHHHHDEYSNDSNIPPQKKARVFFNEEQKEILRLSYSQDPYPNPARIEQMATQLNVTTKTIVNWFHNHRMRSKQQQPGGTSSATSPSAPSPSSSQTGSDTAAAGSVTTNGSVKTDLDGDMSNMSSGGLSDCSQADVGSLAGAASQQAGTAATSMSQWLFPQFEPIAMLAGSRRSSQNSTCSIKTEGDGQKRIKLETAEQKGEEAAGDMTGCDDKLNVDCKEKPLVNKRKSARPQWAYEGTQLERSSQEEDLGPALAAATAASSSPSQDSPSSIPPVPEQEPHIHQTELLHKYSFVSREDVGTPSREPTVGEGEQKEACASHNQDNMVAAPNRCEQQIQLSLDSQACRSIQPQKVQSELRTCEMDWENNCSTKDKIDHMQQSRVHDPSDTWTF